MAEMPVGYRVFVHLVDDEGRIIIQSDAEPADWTRPTTGWAVNEYVVDEHILMFPEAEATRGLFLRVGMYDAATGQRLPSGGSDHVLLPLQKATGDAR